MNFRLGALAGAACLFLLACPGGNNNPDAGTGDDSGIPVGTCTETCLANEVCNTATRTCVSRCGEGAGCDAGVCTQGGDGQFSCQANVTSCNGVTCAAGQNSCIAGKCSCAPAERGGRDSCASQGKICRSAYNAATQTGGACQNPVAYEECRATGCSGACGACQGGTACSAIGGGRNLCLRPCATDDGCNSDEFCFSRAVYNGDDRCYPPGLFGFNCEAANPDGGTANIEVPVANPCKRWTTFPDSTEATNASTCTYAFVNFSDGRSVTNVCRPPGSVGLYGACKADYARNAGATQCAAGLECVRTQGDNGLCLKVCNAAPASGGFSPTPACAMGESCVNVYRQESANSVLGVCMTSCSVFNAAANNGCANYGSTATSCVPVPANGSLLVSTDGTGVCIPQKAPVATVGQACVETDPFKGAACASGSPCTLSNAITDTARCAQPCDLGCVDKADAGPAPARCATEANARCASGACVRVTSTSGATLGFCQ